MCILKRKPTKIEERNLLKECELKKETRERYYCCYHFIATFKWYIRICKRIFLLSFFVFTIQIQIYMFETSKHTSCCVYQVNGPLLNCYNSMFSFFFLRFILFFSCCFWWEKVQALCYYTVRCIFFITLSKIYIFIRLYLRSSCCSRV